MGESSTQSLVSGRSLTSGVVGGLAHTGVAVLLWNYFGFDNLWEMLLIKPLNGAYILLGMFLLGFVPVLFYIGERVISPALVVAVCLLLSAFVSLLAGPARAPSAVPTPFALYVLLWVGVATLAGLTGGLEHRRKRRASS